MPKHTPIQDLEGGGKESKMEVIFLLGYKERGQSRTVGARVSAQRGRGQKNHMLIASDAK